MGKRSRSSTKVDEEGVLELIRCVYDASVDASLWHDFLEKLSVAQKGAAVGMVSFSPTENSGGLVRSVRCDPAWQKDYEEYFADKDVFVAGLRGNFDEDVAWPGRRIIADSDLVKSEFYTDWMAPQDLFHTVHCVAIRDAERVVTLGAGRSKSDGVFDQSELKVWQAVIPHIRRAVQIQKLNSELVASRNAMDSGLSRRSIGLIMVGANHTVIDANGFAEQLLAQDDGLTVRFHKLILRNRNDHDRLGGLIASSVKISLTDADSGGGFMAVSRPSGREPYKMMIVRAGEGVPILDKSTAAAAIYVLDPETEIDLDLRNLQETFHFTDAETRVVVSIMRGLDVAGTAHKLALSTNTVRTHLKRIFEKSGANRQSQLILKILSSMP